MLFAKDKGKEPMEEDLQDPGQEKEIKSEGEEEAKHTGTTIASGKPCHDYVNWREASSSPFRSLVTSSMHQESFPYPYPWASIPEYAQGEITLQLGFASF